MMGQEEKQPQGKLFYTGLNLEERIRKDHLLRKIKQRIDFDFIYEEVRDRYGYNGNVSFPPPIILKPMSLNPLRMDSPSLKYGLPGPWFLLLLCCLCDGYPALWGCSEFYRNLNEFP